MRASTPTYERHIQGCEGGGTAGALEEGPETAEENNDQYMNV